MRIASASLRIMAVIGVTAGLAAAGSAWAQPAPPALSSWHSGLASAAPAGGPAPDNRALDDDLASVSSTSASNAWAVGIDKSTGHEQTLAEHWNGRSWSVVPTKDPAGGTRDNELDAVTAVSSGGAWAVGQYFTGSTWVPQIQHWNGRAWAVQHSPNPSSPGGRTLLNAVAASSGSNAWAAGFCTVSDVGQTFIEHWNGRSWTRVASPSPSVSSSEITGLAVVSPADVWAVGDYASGSVTKTLIEHWNGHAWTVVPSAILSGAVLTSVTATSPRNAWATGFYYNGTANQTLVERWNGHVWRRVASPDPGGTGRYDALFGVGTASGGSTTWSAGGFFNGTAYQAMIFRFTGGTWRAAKTPLPKGATSSFLTGAGGAGWVVGDYGLGKATRTLIERWNGRVFEVVLSPNA